MNLKEEIQDKICHNKTVYRFADNGKAITEHWGLIKKEDAIEIAEKYASHKCKEMYAIFDSEVKDKLKEAENKILSLTLSKHLEKK